jgi:glycosyltransferase involved in cell wall biosynthesis
MAISRYIVSKCLENYKYKPLLVMKGIDFERFNTNIDGTEIRKRYCKSGERMVLTVCRLDPRKNLFTLISAAKAVLERDKHVQFIIVGDGIQRRELREQIVKLGLSANVKMVGEVPDEELPKYFRAADIFVLPTLDEGFGYVFLEAMASGLPIISTNRGAVPENIGDAGILLPPNKPEILAESIMRVLHDDDLRMQLARKAAIRAKRHDWNRLITAYEQGYKSVVGRKWGGRRN